MLDLAPHIIICELCAIIDDVRNLESHAAKLPGNDIECNEMGPDKLLEIAQEAFCGHPRKFDIGCKTLTIQRR